MDRAELLQEAENRGLLPPDQKALYTEAMKRGLVKESNWRETASSYYRPALEAGLSATGGLIGAATGPVSMVAGGTLGYATGDKAADMLDQALGLSEERTVKEEIKDTGKALKEGAMWEAGGASAGRALQATWRGGKWVFSKVKGAIPTQKAANQLIARTSYGVIYAKNADEAAALEKEIPGLKFSASQRTHDPELIKLERSLARGGADDAARIFVEANAHNDDALRNYFQQNFPEGQGIDDVLEIAGGTQKSLDNALTHSQERLGRQVSTISTADPQEAGRTVLDGLNKAKIPIKQAMGALEDAIPSYPMSFDNTLNKLAELAKNPKMSIGQKQAIEEAQNQVNKALRGGKSTFSAVGVRRTLNDIISKHFTSGNGKVAAPLKGVIKALDSDLAEVSKLSRTGKMATHKGSPVDPDRLASEFEKNTTKIAELKASTQFDVGKMRKELLANGKAAMPVVNESEKAYAERLAQEYKRFIGEPPVIAQQGSEDIVKELTKRNTKISTILGDIQPGQDVGAAMNAYNKYASGQWFGKFDKGAVKQALAKGQQAGGTRQKLENIPALFWSPSGADDLIRAVGHEQAGEMMKEYAAYNLLQSVTDPATGQIVSKKLAMWAGKNAGILKKYGLNFRGIKEAQKAVDVAIESATAFEKSIAAKLLKADPQKAIEKAFSGSSKNTAQVASELVRQIGVSPEGKKGLQKSFADFLLGKVETTAKGISGGNIVSPAQFQRIMKQYYPAMKVIYADKPQKLKALVNMQRAYEIAVRNKTSPLGGGSDTAENIMTAMRKFIPGKLAKVLGPVNDYFQGFLDKRVDQYLTRAMFDPDYAQTLASIYKVKPQEVRAAIRGQMVDLSNVAGQAIATTGLVVQSSIDQEPVK